MKKLCALILVLVFAFSLAACTTSGGGNSPSASTSASTSTSPSAASPSAENSQPASTPSTSSGGTGGSGSSGGTVGYVTDDVDHWARDPYNFAFYTLAVSDMSALQLTAMRQAGDAYNFTVVDQYAGGDSDTYITNLQTLLLTKPDGLIIDVAPEYQLRVAEIITESGIPTVAIMDSVRDADGHTLLPNVVMDQTYNGGRQVEFLAENYKNYWGDIDKSKIALMIITWTVGVDLNQRGEGMRSKFEELFPGNPVYVGDTATESFSADGAYNLANATLSAHPEVEYWFITTVTESFSQGAARVAETMMKEDCVLTTSSGSTTLPGEWDNGYDGIWIGNYAVSPYQYSLTGAFGLIAMCDGRATPETLWEEYKRPGDISANYEVKADIMTRANYKQYLGDIVRSFGLEYDD